MSRELKVVAVGGYESVLPFKGAGVDVVDLLEDSVARDEVLSVLRRLLKEGYDVIFVTERVFERVAEEAEEINRTERACVVPLPGIRGSAGIGLRSIERSVEEAVGINIFRVNR